MVILIAILTFCLILGILSAAAVGAFYAVLKNPPRIVIEPARPVVSPKPIETTIEPIPEDILEYVNQESEDHARASRIRYARSLKAELGSWVAVFNQLQREDNPSA